MSNISSGPVLTFNKHSGKFEMDVWLEICNDELTEAGSLLLVAPEIKTALTIIDRRINLQYLSLSYPVKHLG